MRFLDEMELYLSEEKDTYTLYPVDFDLESGISFAVDLADSEKLLAKVAIKTVDGVPIDALNGNYSYDEVYVDVDVEGDTDDPKNADVMLWLLRKLKNMGYDEQTIRFDGEDYYKKPDEVSDISDEDGEPISADSEFDPSTYWKDKESDGEEAEEKDKDKFDTDSKVPNNTSNLYSGDEEEEGEYTKTTSDEEDDEDIKKKKKKK